MKLKEIFDQLTYGELSQVSIGGGASGAIRPEDYPKIVAHVNLGLTALYKRFTLKKGEFKLVLQPGVLAYALSSKFATTNTRSREAVKYINDAAMPFRDDLLKVETVQSATGYDFSLNNVADMFSMRTPMQRMLVVPADIVAQADWLLDDMKTSYLQVGYRANHPKLEAEDIEPEDLEIELPDTHLEALLLFVAARVHTPIGIGGEDNTGNVYMQKYEMACQELEAKNLQIDEGTQYDRLPNNGWV